MVGSRGAVFQRNKLTKWADVVKISNFCKHVADGDMIHPVSICPCLGTVAKSVDKLSLEARRWTSQPGMAVRTCKWDPGMNGISDA